MVKITSIAQLEFLSRLILNNEFNKNFSGTKEDFCLLMGYKNSNAPNYARFFLSLLEKENYLEVVDYRTRYNNVAKVFKLNYNKSLKLFKEQSITKIIAHILRNKSWFFPPYPELYKESELNNFLFEIGVKHG